MDKLKHIFNPLYLIAIVLGILLYFYSAGQKEEMELFFGFAENKETEINLDYPVKIDQILVKPGEFISKDTRLADLTQLTLSKEINDEQLRVNELSSQYNKKVNTIEGKIGLLEKEILEKIQDIGGRIDIIRKDYEYRQKLGEGLKTIEISSDNRAEDIVNERISNLEDRKNATIEIINTQIESERQQLKDERQIYQTAVQRHYSDVGYAEEKMKKLELQSPSDAVIGNVHVREGEYIESFKTMITLYEPNPTSVAGFVHESMMINVKVGDKFDVRSFHNPDNFCEGVVTGLGSRIVEIPERLRKISGIKTYGREVLITIPTNNQLLQKEKVIIYFKD